MITRLAVQWFQLQGSDLTWLFWTKRCEKMSLERSLDHADEEVQRGADRNAASPDWRVDGAGRPESKAITTRFASLQPEPLNSIQQTSFIGGINMN
jgi:hypothetical protein